MRTYKVEHETTNDEIISYIENQLRIGESKDEVIEKLLSVGVAVIERVQSSRDLEFVKKETQKLMVDFQSGVTTLEANIQKNVESQISRYFNPDFPDSYSMKFANYLREKVTSFQSEMKPIIDSVKAESKLIIDNAAKVSNDKLSVIETGIKAAEVNFNPELESSYFGRVKQMISGVESKLNSQLNDQLTESFAYKLKADAEKHFGDKSPVIAAVNTVIESYAKQATTEITNLRDLIVKEEGKKEGILELFDKTAIKGSSFEDEAFEELEMLARPFSDIVEFKGNTPEGGTQSKKGDFLYHLKERSKFIIEAKDQEDLTLKASLDYMDKAMKLRGVEFAVLIFKKETQLPKQVGSFGFYNNNKLITSFNNLDIALRWTRIYLTKVENNIVDGVNKAQIVEKLKGIQSKLKEITSAKSKLTLIQNAVSTNTEGIRTILDSLKTEIEVYVNGIEAELNIANETNSNAASVELVELSELPFEEIFEKEKEELLF